MVYIYLKKIQNHWYFLKKQLYLEPSQK